MATDGSASAAPCSPSEKQAALVALAARLGRENFAPRAERYDREASFPFENYADLKAARLTALCIPEAQGGLGATQRTPFPVLVGMGMVAGFLAGLLGIGGGLVLTPGLTIIVRMPVMLLVSYANEPALGTTPLTLVVTVESTASLGSAAWPPLPRTRMALGTGSLAPSRTTMPQISRAGSSRSITTTSGRTMGSSSAACLALQAIDADIPCRTIACRRLMNATKSSPTVTTRVSRLA